MATGTGNLPNPGMSFSPFAILTAEEMNNLVENIESLATGTGIGDGSVGTSDIADGSVTPAKLSNLYKFAVARNAALTLPVASTVIPFDTVEYDTSSNYNTSNGRFTAPVAGIYHFSGVVSAVLNSQIAWASVFKNGTEFRRAGRTPNATSGNVYVSYSLDMKLLANDYVQVGVTIANGSTASIETGIAQNYMTGHCISPL